MTTLIYWTNTRGQTRRCDATCYDAKGKRCDCICGGINHGVGLDLAARNVEAIAKDMIQSPLQNPPPRETVRLRFPRQQLDFFTDENPCTPPTDG